jgi:WD40 repeat protein
LDSTTGNVKQTVFVPEETWDGTTRLAWSPNGNYLAGSFSITTDPSLGTIHIWEVSQNSARLITTIDRPVGINSVIYWAPDGAKIIGSVYITAAPNSIFRLEEWDIKTGHEVRTIEAVALISLSPDGKFMVLGTDPEHSTDLAIFDSFTFLKISDFPLVSPEYLSIPYISWSANGNLAVGISCDWGANCTPWLWELDKNEIKQHFEISNKVRVALQNSEVFRLNSKGTILANGNDNLINFWRVDTGKLLDPFEMSSEIERITWHPTENICSGAFYGTLPFINLI